jgi:hypothetical protein
MLSHFISRALTDRSSASLSLLLCVPADITPQELGLSVRVAPDPMLAAVLGAGRLLEQESRASIQEAMKEREYTT